MAKARDSATVIAARISVCTSACPQPPVWVIHGRKDQLSGKSCGKDQRHASDQTSSDSSASAATAISIIPDEQEAIDAALRMGRTGDLLLIFADALTRSWKQVTKFKPEGAQPSRVKATPAPVIEAAPEAEEAPLSTYEGLVRDERGVHFAKEGDD